MTTSYLLVACAWIGAGNINDPYRPAVVDAYPGLDWMSTVAADRQPGGICTVRMRCDPLAIAALRIDPNYRGKVTVM